MRSGIRHSASVIRHFLCFVVLAVWLASTLFAQSVGAFVIHGKVSLPDDMPATRVLVRLSGPSGLSRETFSDDNGRYEFREVPRGRYTLTATNPTNPQQFTDPVEADTSRSISGRLMVNIFLRLPLTMKSHPDPKAGTVTVAEATQQVPKSARKAFEEGLKFKSNREPERALASFGRSIDLFPEYFQALAERGHLLVAQGRIEDALLDFKRALQVDRRYGPALRGLGICEFQQKKFTQAIQDLESATAAEPDSAPTYLFLGIADFTLDRREAARTALQQALRLDPAGSSRAHVYLAELYIRDNRPQEAADELREYLAVAPNAPDAAKLRAVEAQLRTQRPKQ
ncbi:MAG TPA: tetratricopeptide repeat protein [Acidobacteriota bacterium]